MKIVVTLLSLVALTVSAPSPQDYPDSSEVELIPPVDTGVGEDDDGGVVLVIRPGSFFSGFPGLGGGFPGFGRNPLLGNGFGSRFPFGSGEDSGADFDLRNILGLGGSTDNKEEAESGDAACGPICQMFRLFEGQITAIQSEIDSLAGKNFSSGTSSLAGNGDYDVNNSTYEIKTLEDGTKVHTNRTYIADKDENGNKFVFHSIIHQAALDTDQEQEKEEQSSNNSPTLDTSVLEDLDPELNEIDEEFMVDTGLTE